jgi:hypothetical protein
MQRLGKVCRVGLLGIIVTGMTLWGMGALSYAPLPTPVGSVLAAVFGLTTAGAFLGLPHCRWTLLGFVLVWGALVCWWSTIAPSNDRDWQPDVAVLPSATVDGDFVTLHNIRNIAYRTDTDSTPRYYDKTFDLRRLESADLISSYWAGQTIAHIFGSFGFGGQDYVAISAETRKAQGQNYSTLAGFFKQYTLIYVVADERDVIRLRTTYRQPHEEVYLYRTNVPPAEVRRLFLDYIRDINRCVTQPEFYNTLTTNCTTTILFHARVSGGIARYNWKILFSGYAPEYAYEIGRLDTRLPFAELKQLSHINARAQAAGDAPDFSQRIRAGLPMPPPASR